MGNKCCSREAGDVDRPLLYQKLEGETKEKRDDLQEPGEGNPLNEAKYNEAEDSTAEERIDPTKDQ